jgi:hypothetical protein
MPPPKRKRPNREDTLAVRLTPAERRIIETVAQRDGLLASTWVRQLAIKTARAKQAA